VTSTDAPVLATATVTATVTVTVTIYDIIHHNKKYKSVIRELIKMTCWWNWLLLHNNVMEQYNERVINYIAHKCLP
jgi:hypothetical protein